VGKVIGSLALLEQHLDRLPLTKAYFETVMESQERFRMRRVEWAATTLDLQGKVVKEWEVVRLAGLGSTYSNKVGEAVAKATERANTSQMSKMAG
jgi:hypothetical protein